MVIAFLNEQLYAQRSRYFCWIPIWLATGIGGYFSQATEPSIWQLIGCLVMVLIFATLASVWNSIWRVLFWVPALVSIGFLVANGRSHLVSAPKLAWHFYGAIEGTIANLDRSGSNKPRLTLIDPVLERMPQSRTPHKIRVSLHSKVKGADVKPGARIMLTASLSPPAGPVEPGGFDFQRKAWFQRLGAAGYSRTPVMLAAPADNTRMSVRLFALRMAVSSHIQQKIPGQAGAFAAAIVTGDRSNIDPAQMGNLRRSNLAHLLAISGLHMGLLTGFIFAVIRYSLALVPGLAMRLPTKKIASVVALVAGFSYLLMSGANVATQRAFVMVAVMIVAVLADRPAITLRAVALAAIIILLLAPESLLEPGFQMSFAATTALVATFEWLNKTTLWRQINRGSGRIIGGVAALVISSAVAGAATAPISAFHFNQISQFGLLANLASVPVMAFMVMPAAVMAGILSLFHASSLAFDVMGYGVAWILNVADFVAHLKGAVAQVPAGPTRVLAILAAGAALMVLWRGRLRLVGLPVWAVAVLIWTGSGRPEILVTDNGRLVGIQLSLGRALNRDKGNGYAARSWLENDGDPATQLVAAARLKLAPDSWTVTLGAQQIGYHWRKSDGAERLKPFCDDVEILIVPNWPGGTLGDCKLVSKTDFRQFGAHAFRLTDKGIVIETAGSVSGTRLWNQ